MGWLSLRDSTQEVAESAQQYSRGGWVCATVLMLCPPVCAETWWPVSKLPESQTSTMRRGAESHITDICIQNWSTRQISVSQLVLGHETVFSGSQKVWFTNQINTSFPSNLICNPCPPPLCPAPGGDFYHCHSLLVHTFYCDFGSWLIEWEIMSVGKPVAFCIRSHRLPHRAPSSKEAATYLARYTLSQTVHYALSAPHTLGEEVSPVGFADGGVLVEKLAQSSAWTSTSTVCIQIFKTSTIQYQEELGYRSHTGLKLLNPPTSETSTFITSKGGQNGYGFSSKFGNQHGALERNSYTEPPKQLFKMGSVASCVASLWIKYSSKHIKHNK